MAVRKPLVAVAGQVSELPGGDTLPGTAMPGSEAPPLNVLWHPGNGSLGTIAPTLNTMYLYRFQSCAMTCQQLVASVTTAVASSFLRMGLYADGGDGRPDQVGAPLVDLGQQSSAVVSNPVWPTTFVMDGRIYWLAMVLQGVTGVSVRTLVNGHGLPMSYATTAETFPTNGAKMGHAVAGVTGALPTGIGALSPASNNNPPPQFAFRRSVT
jgi:hypothetical protein